MGDPAGLESGSPVGDLPHEPDPARESGDICRAGGGGNDNCCLLYEEVTGDFTAAVSTR